ncbi:InlB B-repeat-containing protein [Treponema sp.]|uniref:InlB B-repeat-containing protein n=1 Tax=Treponema sp. TaxID=166 RepID=UPI003FA1D6C8
MKVRNMLRGIPLMLLMVSVVGVFLGCKGSPGSNSVSASYTVKFDSQGGSAVPAVKVKQGTKVSQPANPKKASFTFGGWYKEKECKTLWNFKSDIVTANITLYAKWNGNNSDNGNDNNGNGNGDDNKGAITINFDPNKIECHKKGVRVNNGDKVSKGDVLDFDAKLSKGELIDKWLVSSEDKATSIAFHYTVKSEDIKNGTITVSYTTKVQAKATITFDSSKMTCTKNNKNVNSGDTVYEKDVLFFIATVSADKIIEWKVNAKKVKDKLPNNPKYLSYTITAGHNGQTIKVSYDEK